MNLEVVLDLEGEMEDKNYKMFESVEEGTKDDLEDLN